MRVELVENSAALEIDAPLLINLLVIRFSDVNLPVLKGAIEIKIGLIGEVDFGKIF